MNTKRKLTSKLIVFVLAVMLISVFAFVGCNFDDEEKKETTLPSTGDQTQQKVEYTGPIKNVSEMVEYAGKTAYDNLKETAPMYLGMQFGANSEPVFILKPSADGKKIEKITAYSLVLPEDNNGSYDFYAISSDCSIDYTTVLLKTAYTINSAAGIKHYNPTKAVYDAPLALEKAIATKFGINDSDVLFYHFDGINRTTKTFDADASVLLPDGTTGVPTFEKYNMLIMSVFTKTQFVTLEVKIKGNENYADRDAAITGAMAEFNAGNYVDLKIRERVHEGQVVEENKTDFGTLVVDKNSTNKEYPAA